MEIREVRPAEYAAAGGVVVTAYAEFADPEDPGWQGYLRLIANVAERVDRTVVLVAAEEGRVLGSATIELDDVVGDDDPELPQGVAVLRMLGVVPDARGRGIGRALVKDVIARATAAGKEILILRTTPAMRAAHALYESMGFRRDPSLDMPVDDDFILRGYRLSLTA